MTTITINAPALQEITRAAAGDWAPALRRLAGALAVPLVAAFVAGLWAGSHWRRLLAWARRHQLQGLAWLGLPGGNSSVPLSSSPTADHLVGMPKMVTQRHAAAPSPVLSRRAACHRLRAQGLKPAAIGRELGISRSTVRRELAA